MQSATEQASELGGFELFRAADSSELLAQFDSNLNFLTAKEDQFPESQISPVGAMAISIVHRLEQGLEEI
jgi:hypothetical protein